jgi:hypothetical protein
MSNSIRVSVNCAVHMVGVSNKGRGNPYDFGEIRYNVPFTDLNTEFCVRTACGNEVIPVPTTEAIVRDIKSKNFKFPLDLELQLAADPQNLQRNVCVGWSEITPPSTEKPDPLKNFKPTGTV